MKAGLAGLSEPEGILLCCTFIDVVILSESSRRPSRIFFRREKSFLSLCGKDEVR
jgi:hypothetical protein